MLMSGQHVASVGNVTTYYDFCSNKMIDVSGCGQQSHSPKYLPKLPPSRFRGVCPMSLTAGSSSFPPGYQVYHSPSPMFSSEHPRQPEDLPSPWPIESGHPGIPRRSWCRVPWNTQEVRWWSKLQNHSTVFSEFPPISPEQWLKS